MLCSFIQHTTGTDCFSLKLFFLKYLFPKPADNLSVTVSSVFWNVMTTYDGGRLSYLHIFTVYVWAITFIA